MADAQPYGVMMKKDLNILLIAVLSAVLILACGTSDIYAQLDGRSFLLSSGMGNTETTLMIDSEGCFTGEFYDFNPGEISEYCPKGTIYHCGFKGILSEAGKIGRYTYKAGIIELSANDKPFEEEDGYLYTAIEPEDLFETDEMVIYTPGTPMSALPEELKNGIYWRLPDGTETEELPCYMISIDNNGFIE